MSSLLTIAVIVVLVVVIPVSIWVLFWLSGTMAKIDDVVKEELD